MKFTFVNHVTTNPFFVPTRYGAEDACKLLGCDYQWTGSESANVNEMVNAFNTAVSSKVDGIAVCLVDLKAFNGPVQKALDADIPVLGYNADAPNARLAYIGQDLFVSGQEMGKRIVDLVGEGDVALFIATPGSLNIQPRIDGAIDAIKKSGKSITHHTVATGAALPKELSTIDAYWLGHKDTKGMFAVDAGSTQAVAQVIQKYKLRDQDVKGGGYDLLAADDGAAPGRPDRLHDRPAAVPAGLPPRPGAVHVQGVGDAHRHRGRQHRSEVPGQGDGRSLHQDEVPLRGQQQVGGRHPVAVAVETGSGASRAEDARTSPGGPGRRSPGAGLLGLGRRVLTLREGSVIVITIVVAAYFSVTTDAFLTWENFKTLLPYFAPFAILAAGEVFLMINGEIDLSIGAVYLFTPFLFYEATNWGLPLMPALVVALLACMVVGLINGVFTAVVGINSFIATLGCCSRSRASR